MLPKAQKKIFMIIGAIFQKWTPDSWKKNRFSLNPGEVRILAACKKKAQKGSKGGIFQLFKFYQLSRCFITNQFIPRSIRGCWIHWKHLKPFLKCFFMSNRVLKLKVCMEMTELLKYAKNITQSTNQGGACRLFCAFWPLFLLKMRFTSPHEVLGCHKTIPE